MHFIMKRCILNFSKSIVARFFCRSFMKCSNSQEKISFISNMTFLLIYFVKTLKLLVPINKNNNENEYQNAKIRNKLEKSAGRNI